MAAARRLRSAGFFERLAIVYSVAAGVPDLDLTGLPLDTGDQVDGLAAECARQLDERVDTRHARSALQQADLGPVKLGAETDRFLAEPRPSALTTQVGRELLSDRHGSINLSR
jgi:hypothetical protein